MATLGLRIAPRPVHFFAITPARRADGARATLAYLRHRLASSTGRAAAAGHAAQHRVAPPALPYRAARIGTIAALRLLRRITARQPHCRGHPTLQ
ncbi:hypothetical protein C6Q19_06940 [Burkholderia cenocepacia]|nr:hypothetical protein C6Q19_06940 [Burkholderia cenocepacia]RSB85312.1 hypothetical protein EGT47_30155 [Burkholderia cenocepacia]